MQSGSAIYSSGWLHVRLLLMMIPCAIIAPAAGAPIDSLFIADIIWTSYDGLTLVLLIIVTTMLFVRRHEVNLTDIRETRLLLAYCTFLIIYFVVDNIYWWALLRLDSKYLPGMIILAITFSLISFGLTIVRTGYGVRKSTAQQLRGESSDGGTFSPTVHIGNGPLQDRRLKEKERSSEDVSSS